MVTTLINLAYLLAAALFIFSLKRLQSPATARGGNQLAALYPSDPDTQKEAHPNVIEFSGDLLASGHDTGHIWLWNTNAQRTRIGTPISIFQVPQSVFG